MKKALSLAAITAAAALLTLAVMPSVEAAPKIDEAALNAQIDARLHVVLARLAREAQARRQVEPSAQLASR
jgi:hypothetical protein